MSNGRRGTARPVFSGVIRPMADFYTVLMNSLKKRDMADPAARERVYLRARMALIRKLWAQQPRLTDREIEDEIAVFDLAVGFVESDVAASLPARRRERLRREKASRLVWQQRIPDIRFDLTEGEVEAEADPEETDRLAYRTHLREAAARINQWTEAMVQRIDPVSVATMAIAGARARRPLGRVGVAAAGPAVHETVLAEPIIDMSRERAISAPQGRRLFRSFFPVRDEQPAETAANPDDAEPGRLREIARQAIDFFERLSFRMYQASVVAERRRRGQLTPRVRIRSPLRPSDADMQQRRRKQLAARVVAAFAAIVIVAALAWIGTNYRTEITARVEELTSGTEPVEEAPAPAEAKEDDAAAIAALPEADIVLFDGRDPSMFQAGAGQPVEFHSDKAGGYVRIRAPEPGREGARLSISSGIADRLAGRSVHFVVTARASATEGAGTVRIGYRAGNDTSPFPAQPLGREYRRLEFTWTVPGGSALGEHALLIEPALLGGGNSVDVKSVEIFFVPTQ
jgi:hypothetical protein